MGWTLVNAGAGFVQTDARVHSGDSSAYHNDDSGQQDDWMVKTITMAHFIMFIMEFMLQPTLQV